MYHDIKLDSTAVLNLLNNGTIIESDVSLYDFQKNDNPIPEDLELYERVVAATKDPKYVSHLKWLSEATGLKCLMTEDFYFQGVIPYKIPQSHKDFLENLSPEKKAELVGTFLGRQIVIEFIPTQLLPPIDTTDVEGNIIAIAPSTGYFRNVTFFGKRKGYVVATKKVADELQMLYHKIEVAKEKAIFTNPGRGVNWRLFNLPTIEPIFSTEVFAFDVQGDWYNPTCHTKGNVVVGFKIVGDIDTIENVECKSAYRSNSYENNFIIQVIKDLGVKAEGTWVAKKDHDTVINAFWEKVKEYHANGIHEIKEYAASLGLECQVSARELEFYSYILIKEGEFEFQAGLERTASIQEIKEWLDTYSEWDYRDSYEWNKEYEAFLSKDLPTV